MKKQLNILHIAFLALIIFIMSCETCPPFEHLGTKELFPISKTFIPNIAETKTVIYVDSVGNEMKFVVKAREISFEEHRIGTYCKVGYSLLSGLSSDEISVETSTFLLKPKSHLYTAFNEIEYKIKVANVYTDSLIMNRDTNNIFYDALFLTINNTIEFRTSNRGNNIPDYEKSLPIADTTILGKDFTNVYLIDNRSRKSVLYTKKQGIVSMFDKDGNFWVFDRIL